MPIAVSTNWNSRGRDGAEEIVTEALAAGIDTLELGYALTWRQAGELAQWRAAGRIRVASVHAYCPVPMGAAVGGPEVFSIVDRAPRERRRALAAVEATAHFAAEMGARVVVLHGGRVPIARAMRKLSALAETGQRFTTRYARQMERVLNARDRRAMPVFERLRDALRALLPTFEALGLTLALENLPTWDATPNEPEMHRLCDEFPAPTLGYWHDMGHGQIRENFGFIHQAGVAGRLADRLAGFHVHDVDGFVDAHLMPPLGRIDFAPFRELAVRKDVPIVLEPAPGTPLELVRDAVTFLRATWC